MSAHAFVIETDRHTAGLAIVETNGFRFYASNSLFSALEGRRFGSIAAIEQACRRRETEVRRSTSRSDSRGQVFRSWGPQASAG